MMMVQGDDVKLAFPNAIPQSRPWPKCLDSENHA